MEDLTTGSISRHLLKTAGFMLVMMVFQTLYFLIDLYWVGRLGTAAVAGVAIAGNVSFMVLALMQMLGVGTTTVISHACGRKDRAGAQHLFNQAMALSVLVGALFLAVGLSARVVFANAMSADAETAKRSGEYLAWFIPALALQFPLAAMTAALRGTGAFKPGMIVSSASVVLNMALAPFLIFGWGTGRAYGVAGAAMSTLVSIIVGIVWLSTYFTSRDAFIHFSFRDWMPEFSQWRRILAIGLPTGFEFAMMAVYTFLVYTVARPFGPAAQAGFGIGMRLIQAGFMPVVALGFAAAPVAGQNFGARLPERVRRTFRDGVVLATVAMVVFTIIVRLAPAALLGPFSKDPEVVRVGAEYLLVISWTFVSSGVIFVSSSMFQAMGNTMPSLIASGTRMILLVLPVFVLARSPQFSLQWVWYLSLATAYVQLLLALWMLRREFSKRLAFESNVSFSAPVPDSV